MEHLNRVLKDCIRQLGANKTTEMVIRVGKCIDNVDEILRNYDDDNEEYGDSQYHTTESADMQGLEARAHRANQCPAI